jgi:transcriptional regulator with XRE-family HTH domain
MNGKELRTIRDLSGHTIEQFAETLAIGTTTLKRYERGETAIPLRIELRLIRSLRLDDDLLRKIWEITVLADEVRDRLREKITA